MLSDNLQVGDNMAQWTKRQGAGLVRTVVIGFLVTMVIVILYATGTLENWIGDLRLGLFMFIDGDFWGFMLLLMFIIGIISFCVRSRFNWGGA